MNSLASNSQFGRKELPTNPDLRAYLTARNRRRMRRRRSILRTHTTIYRSRRGASSPGQRERQALLTTHDSARPSSVEGRKDRLALCVGKFHPEQTSEVLLRRIAVEARRFTRGDPERKSGELRDDVQVIDIAP